MFQDKLVLKGCDVYNKIRQLVLLKTGGRKKKPSVKYVSEVMAVDLLKLASK